MNKITLDLFLAKSKTTFKGLFVVFAFLLLNTQTSWGQASITNTTAVTQDFAMGTTGTATLPTGFKIGTDWSTGTTVTTLAYGTTGTGAVTSTSSGGAINWANGITGSATDRSLGFLSAGSYSAPRSIIYAFTNNTGSTVTSIDLSWNYEKSRSGSRAFAWTFFHGNTSTAATAATAGDQSYVADLNNTVISNPPLSTSKSFTLTGLSIANGTTYYLRWTYAGTGGSTNAQGLSIDDFSITVASASSLTPPTLTADATANTVDNNIDITFTEDATWRAAVTAVKIGSTTLTEITDYVFSAGNLQLKPSGGNTLLTTSGSKSITVVATGYTDATVAQTINAGAPTTNSTATISAALAPNTTRTITCTAKDQYNNLVSGYAFGYDVTVTNNTGTTNESYTIDGSAFTATATSGNPVTATTNASGVATFTAALPATIDPSDGVSVQVQLADDTTNLGSAFSFTQLGAQTITFGALTAVTYGDATFDLTATASSSLPVTYASSNTAVATVSGSTVTIVGAGSTTITASQAGNGSFNAAIDVPQTLTVNTIALTIPDAAAASRAYNTLLTTNITGTLTGIINSDDVTFDGTLKGTFADANVANGIAVTSNCTLAGTKAGNYILTQPTGLTANITQASQTITFAALANKVQGDADFSLTGTASSSLTVTYASSNPAVATVSGSTVTIVGVGSTNITASQAGNANYAAATDVVQSLTVVSPPLVAFDFAGDTGSAVSRSSTSNATNIAASSISRGSGLTASANADRFNSTNWATLSIDNAISGNDYLEFTVAPNSGYQFSVSSILFLMQRSGTGLSQIALRSSVDNYATNLDAIKTVTDNTSTQTFTFTFAQTNSYVPVTYRLYGFSEDVGGSGGPEGTGNDIVVTGTTSVAPAVWTTSWLNTISPDATKDAIIDGNYSGASFTAKNLTVNATKTLTVATGTAVTVAEALVNNGTITVQNNANLIQTAVANTNSGSGSAIVNRNSAALKRLDYTMWSSPVSGTQKLEEFSPNTSRVPNRFYTYDAANNVFTNVATTSTFTPGLGYLIRMPNDASTSATAFAGQFTGTLNNGTVTVGSLTSGRYYLVGNPYPSTISATAFLDNNATDGVLYFWRKTNGAGGTAYSTYTSGLGGAAGGSGVVPNNAIQVGQGFIVKATSASLSFTNAMRETTPSSTQFLKTKNTAEKSRLWLDLSDATGRMNQVLIGYLATATQGVDAGIDGKYFNDSPIALTSLVEGEEYVIQGRPTFDVTDVVALGFKTDVAGDYTISLNSFDGLFAEGQDIYLVDAIAGKEIDLKSESYSFTSATGVDNTRFSLKYQKTLKVEAPTFDDNSVKVYKNNGAIYVNSTSKAIKTIQVYDVQGRLIAQQKNVNAATATINNLKAINQMLIVKVSAEDNSVVSKKVMN